MSILPLIINSVIKCAMESHNAHDNDALKEKLTDTLPILKIYALTLTGDAERAADLVQETSMKVLCSFASYTLNINFKGWATTENGEVVYSMSQLSGVANGTTLYAVWNQDR